MLMNPPVISAPTFAWPAAALAPLLADIRDVHAQLEALPGISGPHHTRLYRRLHRLRERAATSFATANGWCVATGSFTLAEVMLGHLNPMLRDGSSKGATPPVDGLDLDHVERFRVGRRPVALLTHSYNMRSAPADPRVRVEELPASWYFPDHTRAWLVQRPRRSLPAFPPSEGVSPCPPSSPAPAA